MQEWAQELTRAPGSVRQRGPAPELGMARALEAALELVLAQKLAPPPDWMPALALGLWLALELELMSPLGWVSAAVRELALAAKLVSETALELGTELREIRCPLWLPSSEHFQDREQAPASMTRRYPSLWCAAYWVPGSLLLLAQWLEPLCGRNVY